VPRDGHDLPGLVDEPARAKRLIDVENNEWRVGHETDLRSVGASREAFVYFRKGLFQACRTAGRPRFQLGLRAGRASGSCWISGVDARPLRSRLRPGVEELGRL
jgi:hypothetical protein